MSLRLLIATEYDYRLARCLDDFTVFRQAAGIRVLFYDAFVSLRSICTLLESFQHHNFKGLRRLVWRGFAAVALWTSFDDYCFLCRVRYHCLLDDLALFSLARHTELSKQVFLEHL